MFLQSIVSPLFCEQRDNSRFLKEGTVLREWNVLTFESRRVRTILQPDGTVHRTVESSVEEMNVDVAIFVQRGIDLVMQLEVNSYVPKGSTKPVVNFKVLDSRDASKDESKLLNPSMLDLLKVIEKMNADDLKSGKNQNPSGIGV